MFRHWSLKFTVTLGVVMILLLVALTIGWVVVTAVGAVRSDRFAGLYWALLAVGALFLITVLVGVVIYLALTVKAIRLNHRQSNFIDSVTHELKSPIASLKLCAQTLMRLQLAPEEQQNFCRYMLEDLERLDQLINHMLNAGRVERGALEGDAEDIDVALLLREAADAVCLRYKVPPQAVHLDLAGCVLRTRRVDLDMICRNLLDNAVKYAGVPPRVEVTLRLADNGLITIGIRDNGRGIPRNLRRKIFGRFVRLGSELERNTPGTGLGLFIVRTLVRRLGGRIQVGEPADGVGTVFEVQLPGGRSAAAPAAAADAA